MTGHQKQTSDGARRRRRTRLGATSWVVLFVIGVACAAVATGVSAQGIADCDSSGSDPCTPTETTPATTPTEQDPADVAPKPDPPQKPTPKAAAPATPQAPAPPPLCSDGTAPPCVARTQDDTQTATKRKLDCRKRPGHRRPKRCPRLKGKPRTEHSAGQRQRRHLAAQERRRVARERRIAESKKHCKDSGLTLFGATPGQCEKAADQGGVIVGRYLSRPLPDALPPGARLSAAFASLLKRNAGPKWPVVLAVLRAKGKSGPAPAGADEIKRLARQLRSERGLDERVQALADYHRAVGLAGLTNGLDAVKGELIDRVLHEPSVSIYGPGRTDVASGRIDARLLVTMLYLADRQGSITVSCLISGHSLMTKSGHISLHASGRAMDIGAVGGTSILGHQQPGGVTENALRNIMLMPAEFRPSELISLFAIGGPSFAMADHADHIHVGF